MPELPEVETIARALRDGGRGAPGILGRTIAAADIDWDRSIAAPGPAEFARRIAGQTVRTVGRRGKFLLVSLDRDSLLAHLRMSGDLIVGLPGASPAPYTRVALRFADAHALFFSDARKFGRLWLVGDPAEVTGKLGPEPLSDEFTPESLSAMLRANRRLLKPLLLDQSFLAGLGNIYTDEALHRAGLHPLRRSDHLTEDDAHRLWQAIRDVLQAGIASHGASIDWVYRGGDFQNTFAAYRRTGAPCPRCGTPIARRVVGQRSTHYCPRCQPSEAEDV